MNELHTYPEITSALLSKTQTEKMHNILLKRSTNALRYINAVSLLKIANILMSYYRAPYSHPNF